MKANLRQRDVAFTVQNECLLRTVTGSEGDRRTYTHRCTRRTYETVAHAIEETSADGEGTTLLVIARQEDLPFSQVNVALEFLKERGLVDVRCRRSYPATGSTHLDAMVEFYALAEGATPA